MYIPRHHHWIFPPTILLTGFYIVQQFGKAWDTYFVLVLSGFIAGVHSIFLWKGGLLYQEYAVHLHDPDYWKEEPKKQEHGLTLTNLNAQVVALPRFDKQRNFAVTLLRMREHGEASVNLTEDRWVRTGKFTRDEFKKTILQPWEIHRLIERADVGRRNSPYAVRDWTGVRMVANGNPLPPLPR